MSASIPIDNDRPLMRRLPYLPYLIVWIAPAAITGFLHLRAAGSSDASADAPVSLFQGLVATFANMAGPWAGHLVGLVDFPNAGLRSFNLLAAAGLTLVYLSNALIGGVVVHPVQRRILFGQFLFLTVLWYGYGFYLIADGLL